MGQTTSGRGNAQPTTLAAFGVLVALVGANVVAVKFSNQELAPFWGAGVRFTIAAGLFAVIVFARGIPLPTGRALLGALLYGLLGFAAFFAFGYWGLVDAPATLGAVVFALVPLITLFLAAGQGLERLGLRPVLGGLLAFGGIAVAYGGLSHLDVPVLSLLAVLAAAVCGAQTNIVVKRLPPGHPVAANAVATTLAAAVLLTLSFLTNEPRTVPSLASTWVALGYLVTAGTLGVFVLFLFVVARWRASSVAYEFVLAPFAAIPISWLLLGEVPTPIFAVGAALALLGVYLGALTRGESHPEIAARPAEAG